MKKTAVLIAVTLVTTAVFAQEQGRVLSATPIIQQVGVPQQVCGNETVYSGSRNSGAGAVMGAIAGGAAGNAIGKGSGRAAATALGVIGGAVLGNQIEGSGRPQYDTVQRCTTETYFENRTVGYNVVYEYAGRQYTTRTQYDPGEWIPVTVQPQVGQSYSTQPGSYGVYGSGSTYAQPGVVTPTYPVPSGYIPPSVTVIEYSYPDGRRPYHHHGNPYGR